jgi:ElaB/YqjD/DUF883 family membrane-anchored ribosome-binding protein
MYTAAKHEDSKEDTLDKTRRVGEDLKHGAHRLKRDIHDTTDSVLNDLGDIKDNLNDMANKAGRQVREYAEYAEENFVSQVREKPVTSIAIAAVVGAVIGAVFFRR